MPSDAYTPTVWHDDADPPIDEDALNHLEDGVESAHERLDTFSGGWSPGDVKMAAYSTPDPGWLLCDGVPKLRSSYPALFAKLLADGLPYGAGDGTTTFGIPDTQGRAPVGKGTHADVDSLGDNEGQAVAANRRPKHRTSITDPGHVHTTQNYLKPTGGSMNSGAQAPSPGTGSGTNSATTGITVGTGNANDSLDQAPFLVFNFFIKT